MPQLTCLRLLTLKQGAVAALTARWWALSGHVMRLGRLGEQEASSILYITWGLGK